MKDRKIIKAGKELPLEETVEALVDTFVTSGALSAFPITGSAIGIFKAIRSYKAEKLETKLKGAVAGAECNTVIESKWEYRAASQWPFASPHSSLRSDI
ncbi:hypothetical protein IMW75_26425 [Pseudomonas gregormendelii]|uniref:Uncharacterized protein n=1 Tax=Pseudomonas gregormendelii TaxID=1628277 RepID=A0ABS3ANN0_9PSED|nr:hypothetical protein [Pseudomonas gregormendelii]MBN3968787.1 hypothetical protein [Pseudomonas gregormendelii]